MKRWLQNKALKAGVVEFATIKYLDEYGHPHELTQEYLVYPWWAEMVNYYFPLRQFGYVSSISTG